MSFNLGMQDVPKFNTIIRYVTVIYHGKGSVDRLSAELKQCRKEFLTTYIPKDINDFDEMIKEKLKGVAQTTKNYLKYEFKILNKDHYIPFLSSSNDVQSIEKRIASQMEIQ